MDKTHLPPDARRWPPPDVHLSPAEWLSGPFSWEQASTYSLVLTSRKIPHRLHYVGGGYAINVPERWQERALHQIAAFERENRHWPREPSEVPDEGRASDGATLWTVLMVTAVFGLALSDRWRLPLQEIGEGFTAKVMAGQWWRLVTSLTLHADPAHLLGNMAFTGILMIFLVRQLGPGLAWTLVLLSGVAGNFLNTLVTDPFHQSIGFSTATFGAVGMLSGLQLRPGERMHRARLKEALMAVGSGLALLAMLGAGGKNIDLGAHLFGFLSGLGLGAGAGWLKVRVGLPGLKLDIALALFSIALVAVAWLSAFVFGGVQVF